MCFESWICSLYGMWGIVNNLCVGMVARRSRLDVCNDIRFISTDIRSGSVTSYTTHIHCLPRTVHFCGKSD